MSCSKQSSTGGKPNELARHELSTYKTLGTLFFFVDSPVGLPKEHFCRLSNRFLKMPITFGVGKRERTALGTHGHAVLVGYAATPGTATEFPVESETARKRDVCVRGNIGHFDHRHLVVQYITGFYPDLLTPA